MKITFLGTGGAFADFRLNYNNNAVVWTDAGPVLLDCGFTAVQSMRELGISRNDVVAVLLTHLHGDHASPELLMWERYYGGVDDGRPAYDRTRLLGPADIMRPLRSSLDPFMNEYADHTGHVKLGGVDGIGLFEERLDATIGGVTFRWFRVPHVTGDNIDKAAYGIEIDDGKVSVLWSGDTKFRAKWIVRAAHDPRVARIFHECLFADPFNGTVHTHFTELDTLPDAVKSRITLMHYTQVPEGTDIGEFAGAAARHQTFEF